MRSDFQNGISKLDQFGLTYDLLVLPTQLPAAIQLAQKFPHQLFVLDHIAKPYIKDEKIKEWAEDVKKLAKNSNVHCKVSGMVTEADWTNWKPEDFTPYLDVVFEAFGVDRIMFGSDWPVCLVAASYQKELTIIERYLSSFSPDEKAKIMGANAEMFYDLNDF